MPIREYLCQKCGQQRERIEVRPADEQEKCGACGSPMVRLFPSRSSFKLGGSGWARDGYTNTKGGR
jgi:putative FmdB family regulatory protein